MEAAEIGDSWIGQLLNKWIIVFFSNENGLTEKKIMWDHRNCTLGF